MDEPIVLIEGLGKSYTQGHEQVQVLEEVDFRIGEGEFVSIVGPSGSGKSTLLNIIGALDDLFSGSVRLFGSSLSGMGEDAKAALRMKNIGFVFQFDSLLPEFTVLENVDMPARISGRPDPVRSLELLKRFGLESLAHKFPMEISGGEKQRVAVLRALRNNPRLVIADEPTGNLDKHNARIVLDDLKSVNSWGASVLMVTHNDEAARYADRIYRLAGGRMSPAEGA